MEDELDFTLSQRMAQESPAEVCLTPGPGCRPNFGEVEEETTRHGKTIRDPIHGDMYFVPAACAVMDTSQVQRLRDLKQLGTANYVYPGASHNRFEHSLGVAYLAYSYAIRLNSVNPELRMTNHEIDAATIAGLCHDLGHGPFSHLWEKWLHSIGETDWTHESMSVRLWNSILDDGVLESFNISEDILKKIAEMISAGDGKQNAKGWMYELVANGRNGLDVDKFDYLQRDAYYCGMKIGADFGRIKQFSKVIDDEICYRWSEYQSVFEVYSTRAHMHHRVYQHKKVGSINYMISDALAAAAPALKLREMANDVKLFPALDDTLLKRIEYCTVWEPSLEAEDGAEGMRQAQAIVRRLRKRDLYKFVEEALIPPEALHSFFPPEPSALVCRNPLAGVTLREEDIIVDDNKVDYTHKNANPVDRVHFYDKNRPNEKFTMTSKHVTWSLPQAWVERRVRIFSRDSNPRVVSALKQAFDSWVKDRFGDKVETATPSRARSGEGEHAFADHIKKRKLF